MESDDYFPKLLLQLTYDESLVDFAAAFGLAFILLCIAAVLTVAESVISSLSPDEMNKIEESHSARDKSIIYLYDNIRLLKAVCGLTYSILTTAATTLYIYAIATQNITTLPLTLLIAFACTVATWALINGLTPKLISDHKLSVTRFLSPIIKAITKVEMPFLQLLSIKEVNPENETHRKKQVPLASEAPNDMYEEKEMLEDIIHFYNKKSNEIMTPRTDIEAIDIKNNVNDVIKVIIESGYSRIPVYEDSEDNIKGILFAKDIIPMLNNPADFKWQSIIRKPFFVPESKKIYDLLNELRSRKTHMAIVVDEFGCTSGLVTMEDIVEEIIGDISDEYDDDDHSFMSLPDGSYIFEGKTQLVDFFRETGISASDFGVHTEEAETLTGLVLAIKGTLPRRREIIDYKKYRFHILEANERRVLKIKFSINS